MIIKYILLIKWKELLKKGFQASEIVSPNPSVRFFFVNDPNGVQIQFVEQ